jgi:hypothetical protein
MCICKDEMIPEDKDIKVFNYGRYKKNRHFLLIFIKAKMIPFNKVSLCSSAWP